MQSYRKAKEPAVDKLKEPVLNKITASVVKRHGLSFTKQDVSSLWFLCKQVLPSCFSSKLHYLHFLRAITLTCL